MNILPNFFIIGAPKCGTTSLAEWLATHPDIYMSPIKEPRFFSSDIYNQVARTWEVYTKLFSSARAEHTAVGEASTTYLFSSVAIPSIEASIPGARYIVMIRNPVDMAYSLHEQQIRSGNECVTDFREAWRLVAERRRGRRVPASCKDPILLDYQAFCRLGEQTARLFDSVPRNRVLLLLLDNVKRDPQKEYLRALAFLGVSDDGRSDFPVFNPAREWRSRRLGWVIRRTSKAVAWTKHVTRFLPKRSLGVVKLLRHTATRRRPRPPIPLDLRAELQEFFEEDVRELERLLGRDFTTWRAPHA